LELSGRLDRSGRVCIEMLSCVAEIARGDNVVAGLGLRCDACRPRFDLLEGSVSHLSPRLVSLPTERYELVSYVRDCTGNCDFLGQPTDECRAKFRIKSGQRLCAVRQQTRQGPCTLSVSDTSKKR
jgi:hypothetical protein